jgi:hypothetical protein
MSDLAAAPELTRPGSRAWETVHIVAGLLLILAATLKAYQAAMPGPAVALRLRLFDVALIEFELAVGGMLLLNVRPTIAWGLAVAAFTVFAGVSVQKALAGAKSCGCFGPAAVNPKLMAAADAAIVVMLLLAGPRLPRVGNRGAVTRAAAVAIFTLMLAAAAGIAFAAIPKHGLIVSGDDSYDFGTLTTAQAGRCEHAFTVGNTSRVPIRITSFKSSCGCTVADVPTAPIPPGGSAEVRVRADWSKVTGSTASTVTLNTDNHWTPRVELTIRGHITPAP